MAETEHPDLQDKIAAAFRMVGEDKDFQKRAGETELRIGFELVSPQVRGVITIQGGRIYWSTSMPLTVDLHVRWKHSKHLIKWVNSFTPLWWHRLLGRVQLDGQVTPVTQECLYLFRNYLKMMLRIQ